MGQAVTTEVGKLTAAADGTEGTSGGSNAVDSGDIGGQDVAVVLVLSLWGILSVMQRIS